MKILQDYLNICDHNPPTLDTHGRTDGRHSYSNTALRTHVIRAVKKLNEANNWRFSIM